MREQGVKNRSVVKKSAGAVIYGDPVKIKVITGPKTRVLSSGDAYFDLLRDAGERIILRVGNPNGEPPVEDIYLAMEHYKVPVAVQLVYRKPPSLIFVGALKGSKQDPDRPGTPISTVTFFLPESFEEMNPGTIYDGFFYGGKGMISTLTNAELFQLVKDMK